jgi:hypothetical protein
VPLPSALVSLPWLDDDNGYGLTFDKQKDKDRAVAQAINAGVVFDPHPTPVTYGTATPNY